MAFNPPYSENPFITFPNPQTVEKAIKARVCQRIFLSSFCCITMFLLISFRMYSL